MYRLRNNTYYRETSGNTSNEESKIEEANEFLRDLVLSHVPTSDNNFKRKAIYLAIMVRRLFQMEHNKLDDKDYYGNKKIELAGDLVALLFEDLFKTFNFELKKQIDRAFNKRDVFDAISFMNPTTITNGLVYALATGNWSLRRFKMNRSGVTQVINHYKNVENSFLKTLYDLSR